MASTLVGLAFALGFGSMAARQPIDLGWLMLDGLGLVPCLMLLRALDLPGRTSVTVQVAWLFAVGSLVAGALWLGLVTGLRVWRHKTMPGAGALLAAGICLSYLLLPLIHYVLGSSRHLYITTASNFFAFDYRVQVVVFLAAAALAFGISRVRRRFTPQVS